MVTYEILASRISSMSNIPQKKLQLFLKYIVDVKSFEIGPKVRFNLFWKIMYNWIKYTVQ